MTLKVTSITCGRQKNYSSFITPLAVDFPHTHRPIRTGNWRGSKS